MSKKSIFWIGLIGTLSFTIFLFASEIGICKINDIGCSQKFDPIAETIFIFAPLFVLSLITYKMRDEVFKSWLKFAYVWVPLTIVATFLAPEYSQSLLPVVKGSVSFTMSALFLLISLVIIISKSHSSKKQA